MPSERFSKKNVQIFDNRFYYRVFYRFKDGTVYYLGDFSKGGKGLIYLEAKRTIEKMLKGN